MEHGIIDVLSWTTCHKPAGLVNCSYAPSSYSMMNGIVSFPAETFLKNGPLSIFLKLDFVERCIFYNKYCPLWCLFKFAVNERLLIHSGFTSFVNNAFILFSSLLGLSEICGSEIKCFGSRWIWFYHIQNKQQFFQLFFMALPQQIASCSVPGPFWTLWCKQSYHGNR